MSYYIRGTRVAYDNIAGGSATGKERTIMGNAGTTQLNKERLKTSEGGVSTPLTSAAGKYEQGMSDGDEGWSTNE